MEFGFMSKRERRKGKTAYRAGARRMGRALGVFLAAAMVFPMLSAGGATAYASEETGRLCEPSTEHAAEGLYGMPGQPVGGDTDEYEKAAEGYGDVSRPDGLPKNEAAQENGLVSVFPGEQPESDGSLVISGKNPTGEDGEDVNEDLPGETGEDVNEDLPGEVTPDNADGVRGQLEEILALYVELTEEEQEQVDISRCLELQAAMEQSQLLSGTDSETLPPGVDAEAAGDAAGAYSLAAEESGEIDFSNGNTVPGNLETDHYHWDAGAKKLNLKDATITDTVLLPDDAVTIETEGTCFIDTLAIANGSYYTKLTFSGTGRLTIEKNINISGGNGNILTVAEHAHVIANGGINIGASGGVDSTVTVNGTLTAIGSTTHNPDGSIWYDNAISAGKVVVGTSGLLDVSGKKGLALNGMYSVDNDIDFAGVFTVEKGGCFTANCEKFNVRVQSASGSFSDRSNAEYAISIPDGYLPTDCKVEIEKEKGEINFVKISTGKVYTGPMAIHENHDWSTDWKKDETAHWKECTFGGCGKRNDEGAHSFDDSGKCSVCGSTLEVTLNGAERLVYDGQEHKPGVTVTVDNTVLDSSKYNTAYSNNTNAGEASVTVMGEGGLNFKRRVTFTIAKATPTITWEKAEKEVTYSGSPVIITPPTVTLANDEEFNGNISYSYAANSRAGYTPGLPINAGTYTVKAGIAEQGNYTAAESTPLNLTVNKALNPPHKPSDTRNVARQCEKVEDVELSGSWQWKETDREKALEIEKPLDATAVYTGADKDNYENVEVKVTITRADCDHEHTEVRDMRASTCQQKGYSGDIYCLDCGNLLTKGAETELADHSGGRATCISGKICAVCGTEYGEKDSTNHVHQETLGQKDATCTADGNTGDVFCKDCGIKISSGTVIPATEHDWKVTGEEAATTTSEGKRIYTCSKCGETREESIPKLPEEHKHDYNGTVEKEATCTEEGVRKYVCACGDSYTESIPKLDHSYRSEVTKQPTVTEEGIRTYTCSRCGDIYEEPIPKLPEENHEHDYREVVEKEATCTEEGVRKYVCACGDSYTESIPKLDHSYRSEVTKRPTVTEEGVRTYTCSRCGNIYTEPIKRLTENPTEPEDEKPVIRDDPDEESRETPEEETVMIEAGSPRTGQQQRSWWILAVCALAIAIGTFFVVKRRREEKDG